MKFQNRTYFLAGVGIIAVAVLVVVYFAGFASGRRNAAAGFLTVEAQQLVGMVATFTLTPAATESPTSTATGTPLPTSTPTATPTATTTPASPEEWADRFQTLATDGLNAISVAEFDGSRAQALLQRIAQEQLLHFVPVSYHELGSEPWAAVAMPRTPDGKVLPMLFWREANDRNRIRSQFLLDQFSEATGAPAYSSLVAGIGKGVFRIDAQGRGHVLLIERPSQIQRLPAYLFSQAQPAEDFKLVWRSEQDPLWSVQANGSQVNLIEVEGAALPDLEILAPMPVDSLLRTQLDAAGIFVEQPPFARQWANTRWAPVFADNVAETGGGVVTGYQLTAADLQPTPLTTLARLLTILQSGNVNDTTLYATRFDLFDQAAELGMGEPAAWVALYLDGNDQPVSGTDVTSHLRVFDNANRQRTFDVYFEQDEAGVYRVAALAQVEPFNTDLITPAPALPTFTPTPPPDSTRPAPTQTGVLTGTNTVSETLNISSAVAMAQTTAQAEDNVLVATNTPLDTPTGTATITPTSPPTPTPTITNTPLPSPTGTATETSTPTETPLPIPRIAPEEVPPLTGIAFLSESARVRGGPSTDVITIASIENETPVDVFGITEAGDWLLIRFGDVIGWVFRDLIIINGDLTVLPLYRADGTPLIPPTATPPTTPGPPTPTATPTELSTPVISQPAAQPVAGNGPPPAPEADEMVLIVGGEKIPANPLEPIPVITNDRSLALRVENATVQLWGGLIGEVGAGWVAAPAELLWAGAQLQVKAQPDPSDPTLLIAERVRIVAPPTLERASVLSYPALAASVSLNSALALIGSREQSGVYLLEDAGTARPLLANEQEATWVSGDDAAGILISAPDLPTGANTFSWVRTDGTGLQIFAQPFFRIRGVAGDAYGGLWWIETPQASLDRWQLWQYEPVAGNIVLRLQASGELFSTGSRIVNPSLAPVLLAARPNLAADPSAGSTVTLLLDTLDNSTQELYKGVFQLVVQSAGDGPGQVVGAPQLLLAPEDYRGPLQISPDRGRLAYFYFNPEHPSLTSGQIRPPNTVRLLTLEGRGANTIRTVYATETQFEFLAPNLAWQGNDRLYLARSRFAEGQIFGVDRFSIVAVQLPAPGSQSAGQILASNYELPNQQKLRDFAACRTGESALMVIEGADGSLQLARWDHAGRPEPLFGLTSILTRTFICWRVP